MKQDIPPRKREFTISFDGDRVSVEMTVEVLMEINTALRRIGGDSYFKSKAWAFCHDINEALVRRKAESQ